MPFIHSKQGRVLVNNSHVSGTIDAWTVAHQRAMNPVTSILDDGEKMIPGLLTGSMNLAGAFNTDASTLQDEMIGSRTDDNGAVATVMPAGTSLGSPAFIARTKAGTVEISSAVGERVSFSFEGAADEGIEAGVVLHDLVAVTSDADGSSVDNGASSPNGGIGTLHSTAFSGLTNNVVKIQDSADNSTWADLITFATVTGTTSEKLAVTGTVDRYTRATWNVTGTGSNTFAVAFARR